MAKKNELMKLTNVDGFADVIKKRYIEKYADDALRLMEDAKKLTKAHEKYQGWVKRLEEGDVTAVEEFIKARKKIEDIDDYELG